MDAASTSAEAGRRRVRVIFVGSPGAGKGTQAAKLAAYLGVPRIATGDMLRETIAKGTPLGQGAEALIGRGKLAPDDLLIALVRGRAEQEDCARGFVLDGFPRTVRQAEGLAEMSSGDVSDWTVFSVEVPREELLRRLSGRRWCPRCQATYHLTSSPPKQDGACDLDTFDRCRGVGVQRYQDAAAGGGSEIDLEHCDVSGKRVENGYFAGALQHRARPLVYRFG